MEKQRPIELIDHNPKPFNDLDGNLEEKKPGLAGCLGVATVAGVVCAYALVKLLVWMEG